MPNNSLTIYISILFVTILSCESPSPNFNPFVKDHPDLNVEKILNDKTLKAKGDCMAFGYYKDFGLYSVFYVVYSIPEIEIVGKGLEIPLKRRTFTLYDVNLDDDFFTKSAKKNSKIDSILKNVKVDTIKIDSILNIYGLTKTKEMVAKDTFSDIQLKQYYWFYKDSIGNEYLFEKMLDIRWLSDIKAIATVKIYFDSRFKHKINKEGLLEVHL